MRKWYGFVAFIGYVASVCAICAAPAPAAAEQNPPRFAFSVDRAGLVSLPLAALPAAADPAMLHVRRRGQEIAVQISTGAIQFVAAAGEGPYTRAASYTVGEGAGFVYITLVRQGSTSTAASVDLNISSGSAEAGKDFIKPASPKVTFAAGESSKTVPVQIIDDFFKEGTEWLYLSLGNASGASLGSSLWGNVAITDND